MMIWQKRAQDKSCDLQYMQIILNLKYIFSYHQRYLALWKIMGGSVTLYWHFKDKSLPSVCNVKKLIVESESANQVFCIRIVFFHRFLHIKFNVQRMKYYGNNFYYIYLVFENTLLVKLVSEYLHYLSCRSCTSPSTKWDMCLAQQAKKCNSILKKYEFDRYILTTQISRSLSIHLVTIVCSIKNEVIELLGNFLLVGNPRAKCQWVKNVAHLTHRNSKVRFFSISFIRIISMLDVHKLAGDTLDVTSFHI